MGKFYIGHVSYKGDAYYGWQKQKDVPTIQQTVFDCIRELYPFGRIDVKATSRTDRGVNAFAQVVKFLAPRKEEPEIILKKLNDKLPDDIVFTQLERIHKSFKVSYLPLFKEYLYFFSIAPEAPDMPFVGHLHKDMSIDLELMREACKEFIGTHNFKDFQYRSDVKSDFIRTIYEADIVKASHFFPDFDGGDDIYCFHVKGKGFLKQMVRLMMGSLCLIGSGHSSIERLKLALSAEGSEKLAGKKVSFIAPAAGLFLLHIEFPEVSVNDNRRHVIDNRNYRQIFPNLELWRHSDGAAFSIEIPEKILNPELYPDYI